ncbi:acetate/propionate family kinase [Janthinobacterium sp. B9-8]|uniref:acetate/propionate family kinase n=1 Tax=Janthinobacterium sp. B9-8 TaxID=1236179 RepID=UPI00061CE25B|nr:acetate/propionate family kinase [Janthinobacterium sp. B9-8]AMC36065.1 acetate kinase [Janthinobacterium sp. B9-8]
MTKAILVLNAGSSSLKFSLFEYEAASDLHLMTKGQVEGIGTAPHFVAKDHHNQILADQPLPESNQSIGHSEGLHAIATLLRDQYPDLKLLGVGHRVVHGGAHYAAPLRLTPGTIGALEGLTPLAPLHQPHNLAAIRAVAEARPDLPQVACFDTAFHRSQEQINQLFGLPYNCYERGIRRYGFHGLSYEYVSSVLKQQEPEVAAGKVVIAHLGNGASMCAVQNSKSVASSMGFTALDGLMMGTRTGNLDAGVVLYLLQQEQLSVQQVEELLYKRSGLLGLSGISSDMRVLLDSHEPQAALAVDYFVHRISRELGSLAASMNGLDALVFTAGIGENSAIIRQRVCEQAQWLGIEIDPHANAANEFCISAIDSPTTVWLIPSNEELMIARHTRTQLGL